MHDDASFSTTEYVACKNKEVSVYESKPCESAQ